MLNKGTESTAVDAFILDAVPANQGAAGKAKHVTRIRPPSGEEGDLRHINDLRQLFPFPVRVSHMEFVSQLKCTHAYTQHKNNRNRIDLNMYFRNGVTERPSPQCPQQTTRPCT